MFEDTLENEEPDVGEVTVVDQSKEPESVESVVERRLQRERAIQERRLRKLFGTKDLGEAAALAEAGRAVSTAAGVSPQTVLSRVQQLPPAQTARGTNAPDDIQRQLAEIRELIASERADKSREMQVAEAKKEYGGLYDRYADEVEMAAEDRGLSLVDAAAVVLRPHLRDYYEEQATVRRQVAAKRKVEGSGEPPAQEGTVDLDRILSTSQKEVAKRMGISLKAYYNQLKELGKAPD